MLPWLLVASSGRHTCFWESVIGEQKHVTFEMAKNTAHLLQACGKYCPERSFLPDLPNKLGSDRVTLLNDHDQLVRNLMRGRELGLVFFLCRAKVEVIT